MLSIINLQSTMLSIINLPFITLSIINLPQSTMLSTQSISPWSTMLSTTTNLSSLWKSRRLRRR